MSKPFTESDLSNIFDTDLIWRRKELSDLKSALRVADEHSKPALLRALVAMSYAHWEGYVRTCGNRYFEFLTLRRRSFVEYERQIYINTVLGRLDLLHRGRVSLKERCRLVNDILDGTSGSFRRVNPGLIDTRSNLNTDVVTDICTVCGVDAMYFQDHRHFLDIILLKRRNAIAHGQQEMIAAGEVDELVGKVLDLMAAFRNLLENKVYTKSYAA